MTFNWKNRHSSLDNSLEGHRGGAHSTVALEGNKDPTAGGAADGDDQELTGFAVDSREIFDVDVDKAWFIGIERFVALRL
jgi:hypothetical protein